MRPKNFKPPTSNGALSGGIVDAVKGEFKTKAEIEYERRRREIDAEIERQNQEIKRQVDLASTADASDDEDAPPRPPPPRKVDKSPVIRTSNSSLSSPTDKSFSSNGYRSSVSSTSSSRPVSAHGRSNYSGSTTPPGRSTPPAAQTAGFVKKTPPPAVVNSGVEVPEVLDFKTKMKMFGQMQY